MTRLWKRICKMVRNECRWWRTGEAWLLSPHLPPRLSKWVAGGADALYCDFWTRNRLLVPASYQEHCRRYPHWQQEHRKYLREKIDENLSLPSVKGESC